MEVKIDGEGTLRIHEISKSLEAALAVWHAVSGGEGSKTGSKAGELFLVR